MSYVLFTSLFFPTQFFVLNLDSWSDVLFNKFFIFWYSILFVNYTNLNSPIICCLFFWRHKSFIWYFYFILFCLESIMWRFCFETNVILFATFIRIKSPVASAVFRIVLFEAVFTAFVIDFVAISRSFWLHLLLKFLLLVLGNDKNP